MKRCHGDNVQIKSVEELALQPETEGGFVLVMQDGKSQTDSVEELALQPEIGGGILLGKSQKSPVAELALQPEIEGGIVMKVGRQ